jgi:hypothetical protein
MKVYDFHLPYVWGFPPNFLRKTDDKIKHEKGFEDTKYHNKTPLDFSEKSLAVTKGLW